MQRFHPASFVLGLSSGALLIFLMVAMVRLISGMGTNAVMHTVPVQDARPAMMQNGVSSAAMAERLGMTEEALQEALASGKTIQEIAEERGIDIPFGRGMGGARMGSGMVNHGSQLSVSAVRQTSDASSSSSSSFTQ